MTKQEERNKRFDEKFVEMHFCIAPILYNMKFDDIEKLKSHLNSEVDLAIAEERKRIVEMIVEKSYMNEYGDTVIDDVDDLLALINKDN